MNGSNESNGQIPEGLKELSQVALAKQIAINEAIEELHHRNAQFLRLFNGGSMDAEAIKARAERVIEQMWNTRVLLETITKPYLD